jgi:hypothetical protein
MNSVRLRISLSPGTLATLRQRAAEQSKPVNRYLTDLIERDARQHRNELAAEGYALMAEEQRAQAEAGLPLMRETLPEWE